MASERIRQLEKEVSSARQTLDRVERDAQEYAREVHQWRTILRQREEKLAEAKHLEAEESR